MTFVSLVKAAAQFDAAGRAVEAAEGEILETACQMVEDRAKALVGVPHGFWPPLSPETLKRKDGINTPLLETGAMRDSIEHTVQGHSGFVGSNDDRALWQELGTSRGIPPRSFLGTAAGLEGPEIEKMAGKAVRAAIGDALGITNEFFHILREAGHAFHPLKEAAEDFLDSDDPERHQ